MGLDGAKGDFRDGIWAGVRARLNINYINKMYEVTCDSGMRSCERL
jgi:hypothetical protein